MTGKTHKSIYYHVVFATKERQPLLNEDIKIRVYDYILKKSKELGLYLHRIGGIEDHVHLLMYIPPKYAVSDIVGRLKGSSSHYVNQEMEGDDVLYWQRGYGVHTISASHFQKVYDYVKNQQDHHRDKDFWEEFEEINVHDYASSEAITQRVGHKASP